MLVVETIGRIETRAFTEGQIDQGDCARFEDIAQHGPQDSALVGVRRRLPTSGRCQPRPKLGAWKKELDQILAANVTKSARERLTLIRIFEELRGAGVIRAADDAVRRYARQWAREPNPALYPWRSARRILFRYRKLAS